MSLYSNIQALGNRMVTNLGKMGVSASFNDGGLTLADKILEIQHFTDGLLLFADKKIEQAGTTQSPNTITLSALLIEDGKAKNGETVMFYGNWNVRQEKISTQSYTVYTVDGDGEFSFTGMNIRVNQGTDYNVGVGSASTFKITISNSTFSFAINGSPSTISSFTYDSTKPLEIWVPIEATNISNKFGYSDTTDSSGVATVSYTCTGAGKKEFYAVCGSIQSEPYTLWDTLFYDKATTEKKNSHWTYATSNITEIVGDEYTTLATSNANSTTGRYTSTDTFTGDFEVLMEVNLPSTNSCAFYVGVRDTANTQWQINVTGWRYIKYGRSNGTYYAKISEDSSTWSDMTVTSDNAGTGAVSLLLLLYNVSGNERTVQFRNIKVYSI